MKSRKEEKNTNDLILVNRGDNEIIQKSQGSYTTYEESLEFRKKFTHRLSIAGQQIARED